ncbi:MAG: heparinase II/III family protein, partial [Thermodesulfovibrionia bacterium]|nr:heparinase II/III family protein [Thermodesulfovibrionia bacterium]
EPPDYSESKKYKENETSPLKFKKFDGLIIARNGSEAIFFNTLHSSQGHSHNDKLSIYPVIWRKPLFLDRGSYSYTGFRHKRQQDRMSAAHNGPLVNDWEQNTIWEDDPYYVNGEAKCSNDVNQNGSTLIITGWHIGYERFRKGLKTYRKVEWNTKERIILIEDWLEGKASQETFQIKWHFLINPIWQSSNSDNCFAFTYQDQSVYFEDFEGIGFKILQSHYCPAYQVEKSCEALNASLKIGIGEKIRFRLRY